MAASVFMNISTNSISQLNLRFPDRQDAELEQQQQQQQQQQPQPCASDDKTGSGTPPSPAAEEQPQSAESRGGAWADSHNAWSLDGEEPSFPAPNRASLDLRSLASTRAEEPDLRDRQDRFLEMLAPGRIRAEMGTIMSRSRTSGSDASAGDSSSQQQQQQQHDSKAEPATGPVAAADESTGEVVAAGAAAAASASQVPDSTTPVCTMTNKHHVASSTPRPRTSSEHAAPPKAATTTAAVPGTQPTKGLKKLLMRARLSSEEDARPQNAASSALKEMQKHQRRRDMQIRSLDDAPTSGFGFVSDLKQGGIMQLVCDFLESTHIAYHASDSTVRAAFMVEEHNHELRILFHFEPVRHVKGGDSPFPTPTRSGSSGPPRFPSKSQQAAAPTGESPAATPVLVNQMRVDLKNMSPARLQEVVYASFVDFYRALLRYLIQHDVDAVTGPAPPASRFKRLVASKGEKMGEGR